MQSQQPQQPQQQQPPQPKKVLKPRYKFTEETLTNKEKGLQKLYEECKKFQIQGDATDNIRKLMNLSREWHFQLAPKFEFQYFIQKCQILGQKAPIRAFMSRIRKVHSGEMTWAEIEKPTETFSDHEQNDNSADQPEENIDSSWKQLVSSVSEERKRKHSEEEIDESLKMAKIVEENDI